jgi:hypothetical protein
LKHAGRNNEQTMYVYHNVFFERAESSDCDAIGLKRPPYISIFSVAFDVLKINNKEILELE